MQIFKLVFKFFLKFSWSEKEYLWWIRSYTEEGESFMTYIPIGISITIPDKSDAVICAAYCGPFCVGFTVGKLP